MNDVDEIFRRFLQGDPPVKIARTLGLPYHRVYWHTNKIRHSIIEQFEAGRSLEKIADDYECCQTLIEVIIRKAGYDPQEMPRRNDPQSAGRGKL